MAAKPVKGRPAPSNKPAQTDGIAAVHGEKSGMAANVGNGVQREVNHVGGIRHGHFPNRTGVAGGQHMDGNTDVVGSPRVPRNAIVKGGK